MLQILRQSSFKQLGLCIGRPSHRIDRCFHVSESSLPSFGFCSVWTVAQAGGTRAGPEIRLPVRADVPARGGGRSLRREVAKRTAALPGGTLSERLRRRRGGDGGGLRLGHLDLAFITSAPFSSIIPEFGVFDIPFCSATRATPKPSSTARSGRTISGKFQQKGLVALAWGENGMRHITNSKRPITGRRTSRGSRCGCRNRTSCWRASGASA